MLGAVLNQFQTASITVDKPLAPDQKIPSSRKFGFHNALLTLEKKICLVGFTES
ncbi:MAG: hypothetical protein M2R45_01519 [Verrucomicrobia subdivision 3 bacterium]|nr:hypothetical protein [Limisphaerales bacterium]MCS1413353.1 hypothetical protein [Limisphaerales bacterium]